MVGPERQALDRSPNNYAASRLQSPINRSIIHATFLFSPHYHHASIHHLFSSFPPPPVLPPAHVLHVRMYHAPHQSPIAGPHLSSLLTTH
jgi:hypothetical protein